MNVIWVVADTFRRDHIGAYGNPTIRTPSLDALAARSIRFDRHYFRRIPHHAHQSRPPDGSLDNVLHGLGNPCLRA